MLDKGIFRMEDYVEGGWVTALKYEDELIKDLEKRTDSKPDKLRAVSVTLIQLLLDSLVPMTCEVVRGSLPKNQCACLSSFPVKSTSTPEVQMLFGNPRLRVQHLLGV